MGISYLNLFILHFRTEGIIFIYLNYSLNLIKMEKRKVKKLVDGILEDCGLLELLVMEERKAKKLINKGLSQSAILMGLGAGLTCVGVMYSVIDSPNLYPNANLATTTGCTMMGIGIVPTYLISSWVMAREIYSENFGMVSRSKEKV